VNLVVFCFHGVVAELLEVPHFCFTDRRTFRHQLIAIKLHGDILPLDAALDRLWNGDAGHGDRPICALTFDDGYQSWHDLVLPILVELDMPATCFVNTSAIATGRPLWFCRLHHAFSRTAHPELAWAYRTWPLATTYDRAAVLSAVETELKDLPGGVVDDEVDGICRSLDVDPDGARLEPAYRPLDEASIGAMVGSGLVQFGAHGHRHLILSSLDPESQVAEVVTSVDAVRRLTGQSADVFAYPNGQADDYDEHTFAALERAGVSAAVTAVAGECSAQTSRWELPRRLLGPQG
jgi:peptidoglycan/xylan/chitin deacetylase (PgdA/CDA1 family)